jgi:4'-phosphopantetheinyl transferase
MDEVAVHVWHVALDGWAGRNGEATLDPEERLRADRLTPPILRRRFVAAHIALRGILGRTLGVPPDCVSLSHRPCTACGGPHGKPVLADGEEPTRFNLSRSAAMAVVAVARGREVGVDIELVGNRIGIDELSSTVLGTDERDALLALPPACREAATFRAWSHKEALLKAWGDGLNRALTTVSGTQPVVASDDGQVWTVVDISAPPGYVAALAIEGETPEIVCQVWTWTTPLWSRRQRM